MNPAYNKSRGQSAFLNKIAESLNGARHNRELAEQLAAYFADHVCAMPKDPEMLDYERATGQPHFAAGRMADACIQAVGMAHVDDVETAMREAMKIYENTKAFGLSGHSNAKSSVSTAVEAAFQQEILGADAPTEEIVVEEEDEFGNVSERTILADNFSMTQFVDLEDLTTEGRRAMGMLPSSFDGDVDDGAIALVPVKPRKPRAAMSTGEDGFVRIACPTCSSTRIYPDGSMNEFACLECGAEFEADLGLGDFNDL